MTTHDTLMALVADLRSRINPAYSTQLGTESYERRICAEALESLIAERDAWKQSNADQIDLMNKIADERDVLALDAARFRFLAESGKEILYRHYKKKTWFTVINPLTNYEYTYEDSLDTAVDEAMKGTPT